MAQLRRAVAVSTARLRSARPVDDDGCPLAVAFPTVPVSHTRWRRLR